MWHCIDCNALKSAERQRIEDSLLSRASTKHFWDIVKPNQNSLSIVGDLMQFRWKINYMVENNEYSSYISIIKDGKK